jgi:bifunctional non-homologous end joining protein LigD
MALTIPRDRSDVELTVGGRRVRLTNLDKLFWRGDGITKRALLQYYADVSRWLLPHLADRAMVMKRYPNGAEGKCFFMKRVPDSHPEWLQTCAIEHASGRVIDFPMVQDLASLLWVVNLGCIDLNQWYARCDDVDRPDYLHFDLDPVKTGRRVTFSQVLEAALAVGDALEALGMRPLVKTTGSAGCHVHVPIVRGPTQKEVWTFAKALAQTLAAKYPKLLTAVYRIADRPSGRVLVDYNQNAWGRTASHSRISTSATGPRASARSGISGSRSCRRAAASGWSACCDPAAPAQLCADGSQAGPRPPHRRGVAVRAQVGRLPLPRLPRR